MLTGTLVLLLLAQPRLQPPAPLACDRNQLTSFSGVPTRYSRAAREIRLSLRSDEDTRESFRLRPGAGEELGRYLLFEALPWDARHWREIESAPGKLKKGVRVTVWVCEGGGQPVIDWRPPPR